MNDATAEVVLPCDNVEETVDWFVANAGFRMTMLRPADDPREALLVGHGLTMRLDREQPAGPTALRITVDTVPDEATVVAPNGTTIFYVSADEGLHLPANRPEFVLSRFVDADFGAGRAGMGYRDLVPARHGGRYIASHISIPVGGPVADYVHHHHVRFQMIFCHAGWADLVYEDQGQPFRFETGDCVLQPPHIRHRVLRTSDEFEVVEISSPAEHDTLRDHDLELPTPTVDVDRDFGGQRFVCHRRADAVSSAWTHPGFAFLDTGIGAATGGLAHVGVVRVGDPSPVDHQPAGEFELWFVREGEVTVQQLASAGENPHRLRPRDCVVLHPEEQYRLAAVTPDFEMLQVRIG